MVLPPLPVASSSPPPQWYMMNALLPCSELKSPPVLVVATIPRAVGGPGDHRRHQFYPGATNKRFDATTCLASPAISPAPTSSKREETVNIVELEEKKLQLLRAVQDTQRGLVTTADQRSSIEECMVAIEGFDAGEPLDLAKLDGTWRLQYTSASDVLILFESATRLPFFQVGQIFQKFECRDHTDGGYVQNVVKWSIPNLLEEQEGATLLVSAKFSVVSKRNIYLQFEEASIQNINISEELESLIAPAILPRSFLSLQILQFFRAFKTQISLVNEGRRSPAGLYYLSYLDSNMLLGRAVGGGGSFVFTRAQALT